MFNPTMMSKLPKQQALKAFGTAAAQVGGPQQQQHQQQQLGPVVCKFAAGNPAVAAPLSLSFPVTFPKTNLSPSLSSSSSSFSSPSLSTLVERAELNKKLFRELDEWHHCTKQMRVMDELLARAQRVTFQQQVLPEFMQRRQKLLVELTVADGRALGLYTGNAYKKINASLRAQTKDKNTVHESVPGITKALHKLMRRNNGFPGLVWRGCPSLPASAIPKEGGIYSDAAFVSTANDPSAAAQFLDKYSSSNVFFSIQSKTGVNIAHYSRYTEEAEVVFAPGTMFRVNKITMGTPGGIPATIVAMEEISASAPIGVQTIAAPTMQKFEAPSVDVDYQDNATIFGKILQGRAPVKTLHETDNTLGFWDVKPRTALHGLVIPKQHIPTVFELQPKHVPLLHELKESALAILRKHQPDALETGDFELAFHVPPHNSVDHLHLHCLAPASELGHYKQYYNVEEPEHCVSMDHVLSVLSK